MKKTNRSLVKILSALVAVALILSCIPALVISANDTQDNSQQVVYSGDWNPSQYPIDGTLYKERVAVSKTVAPTELENYFDITLKVVAKPRVIDRAVDVMVVMDVSNTMNYTHESLTPSDAGYKVEDSRLSHAKNAVDTFLELYAVDENLSSDRRFGLVTFNSYANTVIPLTEINSVQKAKEIEKTVDGITAPNTNREKFTNIEGGLQLAHNLLKGSDAPFKYIVFITDGFPTTYIESGRNSTTQIVGYDTYTAGSYNASKVGTDGYFADAVTGKVCSYGVNYSDKAADRADDVAAQIKGDGINIFSVGVDVGVQSIMGYLDSAKNTAFTTVDRTLENSVIGYTPQSYKTWLSDSIAGGPMIDKAQESNNTMHKYAQGNSKAELTAAFENILKDIELIPSETMEEAYTLDPMSGYVDFLNFYDKNGEKVSVVTNSSSGKTVAEFNEETKTIKWWLTATQNWYIDNIGNYVLSQTYRVRLKNEAQGFDYNTALLTNGTTTFYFKTMDFVTGEALFGDNSIDYPVPTVEGYCSDLVFVKQDAEDGTALSGAKFSLEHRAKGCSVCKGDANIAYMTAVSDEQGVVEFKNIPSGHEYVLVEKEAPEGYQRGAYHGVEVAYGKTYIDGKEVTEENPAVILNTTIEPVSVSLTARKTLVGRELEAGEFSFVLEGDYQFGNTFHDVAANDESGMVKFHDIIFDEVGTYNFTMRELQGDDSAVIYDSKVYEVLIQVNLSEDGKSYDVATFVDGVQANDAYAPVAFEFTNVLRESAKVTLEARKTLDGKSPDDGVFLFNLKSKRGALIQQKTTTDGVVRFDELSFDTAGIYRFSISEQHLEDERMSQIFFDHSVYFATVMVTAPKDNGPFEATVTYALDGEVTDTVLFENKTRAPATLTFEALKTLDGGYPENEEFNFEIRNEDGGVVEQVSNDRTGAVKFAPLTFDKTGHYHYTVSEVARDDDGFVYDTTVYTVGVTVEARHNVESYYLDVIIKKPMGDDFEVVAQLEGAQLNIGQGSNIVFENEIKNTDSTETTVPEFSQQTDPAETSVPEFSQQTDPAETTAPESSQQTDPAQSESTAEDASQDTKPSAPNSTDATGATGGADTKGEFVTTGDASTMLNVITLAVVSALVALAIVYKKKHT